MTKLITPALLLFIGASLPPPPSTVDGSRRVIEQEPNELPTTATRASVGDTLVGEITSENDVDFFAIDIPAGTLFRVDRKAGGLLVLLLDTDSTTLLSVGVTGPIYQFLSYPITEGGRYFLKIVRSQPSADHIITGPYVFHLIGEPFEPGPGDPALPVAALNRAWELNRLAAGRGELYAVLHNDSIMRIDQSAQVSLITSGLDLTGGAVVDALGNLIVSARENGVAASLWRIPNRGPPVRFASLGGSWTSFDFQMAIGPDGDIWAGEVDTIWRFDALGVVKRKIAVPKCQLYALAISPRNEPYFASRTSGCGGIHRVTPGGRERVLGPGNGIGDSIGVLAFDQVGNLYVGAWDVFPYDADGRWGAVWMYDSQFRFVRTVAHVPSLSDLTFGRDADGRTTSRLFASQGRLGRVVELNGASDRQPGSGPVPVDRLQLQPRAAVLAVPFADTLRVLDVCEAPVCASEAPVWTMAGGTLPAGLTLSADGLLAGTPSDTGRFAFSVRATTTTHGWIGDGAIEVSAGSFSVSTVIEAMLEQSPVSSALTDFLDRYGNRNGRLDVGDVYGYLRGQGQLGIAPKP